MPSQKSRVSLLGQIVLAATRVMSEEGPTLRNRGGSLIVFEETRLEGLLSATATVDNDEQRAVPLSLLFCTAVEHDATTYTRIYKCRCGVKKLVCIITGTNASELVLSARVIIYSLGHVHYYNRKKTISVCSVEVYT